MPRKKLIRTDQFPYHVTTRTNNKNWFSLPLEETWNICLRSLHKANKLNKVNLHAFVLMKNHYHLLLETPEANLVTGMKWLQGTYYYSDILASSRWANLSAFFLWDLYAMSLRFIWYLTISMALSTVRILNCKVAATNRCACGAVKIVVFFKVESDMQ